MIEYHTNYWSPSDAIQTMLFFSLGPVLLYINIQGEMTTAHCRIEG